MNKHEFLSFLKAVPHECSVKGINSVFAQYATFKNTMVLIKHLSVSDSLTIISFYLDQDIVDWRFDTRDFKHATLVDDYSVPLWKLLDDVDTMSDICKSDLQAFHSNSLKIAARRANIMESVDGHTLQNKFGQTIECEENRCIAGAANG